MPGNGTPESAVVGASRTVAGSPPAGSSASPTLSRTTGRRLVVVLALGLGLLVQGAYSFLVVPEPYPAIRMPSFGGAPDAQGLFPTTIVDITITYRDGTELNPGVEDLMGQFRHSAQRRSLDFVFLPENNEAGPRPVDDPEVRSWLADRATVLGGGREPESVRFCWRAGDVDVHTGGYVNMPACELTRIAL